MIDEGLTLQIEGLLLTVGWAVLVLCLGGGLLSLSIAAIVAARSIGERGRDVVRGWWDDDEGGG